MKDSTSKIQIIVLLICFTIFEIFLLYAGVLFPYRQMYVRDSIMIIGMIAFPVAIFYFVKRK